MAGFFHTLVVLGSGATLAGCGGRTLYDTVDPGPAAAGSGGVGGAQGSGGRSGSLGGAGSAGSLAVALQRPQWDCSADSCFWRGDQGAGLAVYGACPTDTSRPTSAADCAPNQWFECSLAYWQASEPLLVNCRCVPPSTAWCSTCQNLQFPNETVPVLSCEARSRICACAYTGIPIPR